MQQIKETGTQQNGSLPYVLCIFEDLFFFVFFLSKLRWQWLDDRLFTTILLIREKRKIFILGIFKKIHNDLCVVQ